MLETAQVRAAMGRSLRNASVVNFLVICITIIYVKKFEHSIDRYIATRFQQQVVRFFHAENIEGFRAHCHSGHLSCRKELVGQIPDAYTHFVSDSYDTEQGLDARVYGNIYDIGSIYSRANLGLADNPAAPNIYGPIIFVFRPEVFSVMHDIVITQQSSWTLRPRWREVSITTEEQVETVLRAERAKDNVADAWQYAEVSCANTKLPLTYLEKIIVEPLNINININASPREAEHYPLETIVRQITGRCGITVPIEPRNFAEKPSKVQNLHMLGKLIEFCEQIPLSVTQDNWDSTQFLLPPELQVLPDKLKSRMLQWARYFTFGSLRATRR